MIKHYPMFCLQSDCQQMAGGGLEWMMKKTTTKLFRVLIGLKPTQQVWRNNNRRSALLMLSFFMMSLYIQSPSAGDWRFIFLGI